MKTLFFSLLLTLSSVADNLSWRGDYDTARKEAVQHEKALLVLLVKAKEVSTHKMLRELFADRPYLKTFQSKSVAVLITYEHGADYPVELYYTTRFPALFIVDEDERFVVEPLYGEEITAQALRELAKRLESR